MKKSRWIIWATATILFLSIAPGIWGQDSDSGKDSGFVLEEITVTAQRREENAQKSTISMSVVGGQKLAQSDITDTKDLLDSVPGLDLTQNTPSANLSFRGQGSAGGNQYVDPVMAFNIGGIPMGRTFSLHSSMYDVARVEVLKGPQGTLYGRNATVGAINVIPNRPQDKFEGSTGVTIGNYSTLNTRGMINVPLNEVLFSRVAFSTNHHDGYLTNGYNDQNDTAGRASLLYKPDNRLSLLLWADYFHDDSKGPSTVYRYVASGQEWQDPDNPWFGWGPAGSCGNPAYCPSWGDSAIPLHPGGDLVPFDHYQADPTLESKSVTGDDGYLKIKQQIYAAELNYRFSNMNLTVIPAYVVMNVGFNNYMGGLNYISDTDVMQKSVEARLASNDTNDWKWLVGTFYYREDVDAWQEALEVGGYEIQNTPNLTSESMAVFGETTIPITDEFRLVAGLRYTHDKKTQDGFTLLDFYFGDFIQPSDDVTVVPGPATAYNNWYPFGYAIVKNSGELSNDDLSWKIGLETDLSEDSLLYANVRTAYKSGGFFPGLPPNTYKPEKLTAYELGSKNRFFNSRLQANLEVFYWDYKDQQIPLMQQLNPAGQSQVPVNVPGYLYGAELAVEALVTPNDQVGLEILYEKGKYDVFPKAISPTGTVGGLADYDRVNMPEWDGTVKYQHAFNLAEHGQVMFGANCHFESKANLNPVPESDHVPGDFRDAFAKFDATLTYTDPTQKWEVSGYVKNISDVAAIAAGGGGTIGNGIFYRSPANINGMRFAGIQAPRTFGVILNMKF